MKYIYLKLTYRLPKSSFTLNVILTPNPARRRKRCTMGSINGVSEAFCLVTVGQPSRPIIQQFTYR